MTKVLSSISSIRLLGSNGPFTAYAQELVVDGTLYIYNGGSTMHRQDNLPVKEIKKLILSRIIDPNVSLQDVLYCFYFDIRDKTKEYEELFVGNPEYACFFAHVFGHSDVLKASSCTDPRWASYYARYVDKCMTDETWNAVEGTEWANELASWFALNDRIRDFGSKA